MAAFLSHKAYIVADGVYSGVPDEETPIPTDNSECMNHSCNPSCWFDGDDKMVATRDIQAGEEVCYDYATSEAEESTHFPMNCCCGQQECRKVIRGDDYKNRQFQEKYKGHFTSFIQSKIDRYSNNNSNS